MKRKGGSKKAKAKKPKLVNTNDAASDGTFDIEKKSVVDGSENREGNSVAAETKKSPSPSRANDQEKVGSPDLVERPISSPFGKVVYTRVKVKLKSSKKLESPPVVSEAAAKSDADKSNHQVSSEQPVGLTEKLEESSATMSDTNGGASTNTTNATKKVLGIKIKSSKGTGSSSMSPCSNTDVIEEDLKEKKDIESQQDSRHNEQELKLALEVIKKVMKMDAAEPFNAPVDPVFSWNTGNQEARLLH